MQDLTPVGLTQDQKKLVLISSSGEEFAVLIDSRLRAAMRGDNIRLAQLEIKMESALRPRDIQARIRAGESPEKVAAAAQTTVDAIMAFAQPVLDERVHVAQSAMIASVRRRGSGSSTAAGSLRESTQIYLQTNGLHDEDVAWDAWRRPDGVWVLVGRFTISGQEHTAEFTHDLRGRYVVAENDAARALTGESQSSGHPAASETQVASSSAAPFTRRSLTAVPAADELPLGDDALDLVREPAARVDQQPSHTSQAPPAVVVSTTADRHDSDSQDTAPQPEIQEFLSGANAVAQSPNDQTPTPEPTAEGEAEVDEKPRKRRGRASVPSWDEIMFGGGGKE